MQNTRPYTATKIAGLSGWTIRRTYRDSFVEFAVYEGDNERPALKVELWLADDSFGGIARGPEISWPSTSDKRPSLALALAAALTKAAEEAM